MAVVPEDRLEKAIPRLTAQALCFAGRDLSIEV